MKDMKPLLLLASCLLVSVSVQKALAQEADLSGTVQDASHALIVGASVDITGVTTGVRQATQSNNAGAYRFGLQPGTYVVDVSAAGFKSIHRTNVVLQVAQPARLDFTLSPGTVGETITVNSGAEALQQSTSVGTTITGEEIARLPVDGVYGRNYTSLVTLTPGTSNVSVAGSDGTISGTQSFSVNGQRNPDNNYTLDGVDNNFLHKQAPGASPPMDAIQEFRVATNNSAEYGRSAGANIAVVTKSGSRDFHGTVYLYSRQALFDANDWFRNHNGIAKGPFHYAEFGGTFGGPLFVPKLYNGREKTFFFFAYEGFRSRTGSAIISTVPTVAERTGDFSAAGVTIFDPQTSVATGSTVTRKQFVTNGVANVIPQSRLDPVSLAYVNTFLPLPNLPGQANNYINTLPANNHRDVYVGRFDHHFNQRQSIFFRALSQEADQLTPKAQIAFTELTSFNVWSYAAGYDYVLGSHDLLQVRFGSSTPKGPDVTRNTLGITRDQFFAQTGVQLFAAISPYNVLPSISATDFSISETGGTSVDTIYEADVIYSHESGANLFKYGFTFEPRHYYHDATSPTSGTATYTTALTSQPSNKKSGSGTASFLLGYPSNIDRAQGSSDINAIQKFYAGFAGWNRKVNRHLTTDVSLRYEFYKPPVDKMDRLGTLWVHTDPMSGSTVGTLLWAGVNPLPDPVTGALNDPPNQAGFGRGLQTTRYLNFMPRVGIAYLINDRTIIRTGYGLYDNSTEFQEAQDARKFYPYNNDQTFTTNTGTLPDTTLRSTGPSFTSTTVIGGYAQDPNKKTPYSQQFNLTIERSLSGGLIAQAAYVGSVNKHQIGYTYFNTAPVPGPGAVQPRRLLPQYGDVAKGANAFPSNYNALQLLVNKRYAKGVQFQANYTYGKAMDEQSSLGEISTQNPYNLAADYSRSSFDITHIFNLSFVYDLPFGRGRELASHMPRIADAIAGGWSIESINRFETGPPLNATIGGVDEANVGTTVQRPNVSGDPNAGPHNVNQWFNTAAFSLPAQYTFGNSGAFTLHQDGQRISNVAVYKRLTLFEHQSLDVRGEAFNVANTPSFGSPSTNQQSSSFGKVTAVSVAARQLQFAVRYSF